MPNSVSSINIALTWLKDRFLGLAAERELLWLFIGALAINVIAWLLGQMWYLFNPLYALFGLAIVGVNVMLALVFVQKDKVIAQSLATTALVVQILLLVLVLRMGVTGI